MEIRSLIDGMLARDSVDNERAIAVFDGSGVLLTDYPVLTHGA